MTPDLPELQNCNLNTECNLVSYEMDAVGEFLALATELLFVLETKVLSDLFNNLAINLNMI